MHVINASDNFASALDIVLYMEAERRRWMGGGGG